jgi:hypothetical protein
MTKIIDFKSIKEAKQFEKLQKEAKSFHDLVLDYCDEIFPEGVVLIAMVNGELEISSTIEDEETMFAATYAAAKTIKDKLDGE